MLRRDFCKMMAAAAAATAVPESVWLSAETIDEPAGFNKLTHDYAQYCATPADQRVFYSLVDGKIVSEKLDDNAWKSTEWGKPPDLPIPGGSWDGVPMVSPLSNLAGSGPYQPTWESLLQYEAPEWYRDAKFGIWAHWSPQCVPEAGDWYARNMYVQGSPQNKYQLEHYGPPSRFGYKDLCAQWTLLNWEPEALIERYKKAGAQFFVALANHHDGFDTWNSKHQPWNAMNLGPHRDVIGGWAAAARAQGLRLGVTVHQARNWWWFQTAHGSDKTGPLAGARYDGALMMSEGKEQWWQGYDPQQLYGVKHPENALPDISYVKNFYDRTRDLIDQHDPDLLYFDNSLFPLGWAGMNIGAYFYNHSIQTHGGAVQGVINIKDVPDKYAKAVVADYERGLTSEIMPYAWQSETCIGEWHYNRRLYEKSGEYGGYLPPRDVIHWLIDTVSKNGTFVLNVPGKPDGTIDSKEIAVLDRITEWMQANGEAIYATRPWKVSGEGPNTIKAGKFQGQSVTSLGEKDIRFTRNKAGNEIYAIVLGWPAGEIAIQSLGMNSPTQPGKIGNVQLIGTGEKVQWTQAQDALRVELPRQYRPTSDFAAALKVSLV
ncbi:MAG: alpha-L-fucosidase [Acidobacteriaceae bacterium]|nr:alpha-L-fucosidase [Acidobacteriaceae bacterium]